VGPRPSRQFQQALSKLLDRLDAKLRFLAFSTAKKPCRNFLPSE
jgi:hypothetical protein